MRTELQLLTEPFFLSLEKPSSNFLNNYCVAPHSELRDPSLAKKTKKTNCDRYLLCMSPLCSLHLNNERPSKINNSTCRPSLLVCLHGGRNFWAEIYKFNQQSHSLGPTPPSYLHITRPRITWLFIFFWAWNWWEWTKCWLVDSHRQPGDWSKCVLLNCTWDILHSVSQACLLQGQTPAYVYTTAQ